MRAPFDRVVEAYSVVADRSLYPQFRLPPKTTSRAMCNAILRCVNGMTDGERRVFLASEGSDLPAVVERYAGN